LFIPEGDAVEIGASGGAVLPELGEGLKGFLDPKASLQLKGKIPFVDDPEKPGLKVIKVKASLGDRPGEAPAEVTGAGGYVRKVTDLAKMSGGNVAFKPDTEYKGPLAEGRRKDWQDSLPPGLGKPPENTARIHGPGNTLVSVDKDRLYAVEIRTMPLGEF